MILAFCLLFPNLSVWAEQPLISLSVSPHTFDIQVLPGDKIENKVRFYNQSEVAVPIQVKVLNFKTRGEKGAITFAESQEDISINPRKWIEVKNHNLILEPKESRKINFLIDILNDSDYFSFTVIV